MSSLSLFTISAHEGKPGLEPLSANISLTDTEGDVHNDGPIQVQSAGMLNGQFLLAGAYPDGLLLLKRDVAQEEASCEARQQEREKEKEKGMCIVLTVNLACTSGGPFLSASKQIPYALSRKERDAVESCIEWVVLRVGTRSCLEASSTLDDATSRLTCMFPVMQEAAGLPLMIKLCLQQMMLTFPMCTCKLAATSNKEPPGFAEVDWGYNPLCTQHRLEPQTLIQATLTTSQKRCLPMTWC